MASGIKGHVGSASSEFPAYIVIRGVNPPPHVAVRMQTHPQEFPEREPDDAMQLHRSFQLPLIGRMPPDNSKAVPTISAGEFVRGVQTLFACVRKSYEWESADIVKAIAGWWNSPADEMVKQCENDTFARQVYAIVPEIGESVWNVGECAISCASIILAVENLLSRNPIAWNARWKNLLPYKDRVEVLSKKMEVSSDLLFSLVEDANVLAALNGTRGETSYVGDFIGYPSPLATVRAPKLEQPERFLSLAASAMDSGYTSFHDLMFYVGSQGALNASKHPYPVTHASIRYRAWYSEHFLDTELGRLIGSPSLLKGLD